MTSTKSYLSNFKPFDGQFVSFGGGIGGKVSGKGTIKAGNLDFENVYYVKNSSIISSVYHRCVITNIEFYSQKMNAISYLRIISSLKKVIFCLNSLEKVICIALI